MPPKGQHPKRGVRIKSARVRLRLNKSEKAKLIKPIAFNNLSPEDSLAPQERKICKDLEKIKDPDAIGKLGLFPKIWEEHTSDWEIIRTVQGGGINFLELPFQERKPNLARGQDLDLLRKEVEKLRQQGVVEFAEHEEGEFISRIFLVKKKDKANFRLILDLSDLNEDFVEYKKFKMETLKSILRLVTPDCWFYSIDFSDAYYSIPVHPSLRKYLRFELDGKLYQYTCMPNGYKDAPRLFTKLLKVPLSKIRRELKATIAAYLDDSIGIERGVKEELRAIPHRLIQIFQDFGYTINFEKSSLDLTKTIEFLGFIINSIDMTVSLSEKKTKSVRTAIREILHKGRLTIREVCRVIGKIIATMPANRFARRFTTRAILLKDQALRESGEDYDSIMQLSEEVIEDFREQERLLEGTFCPIFESKPQLTLKTDASNEGWGVFAPFREDNFRQFGGRWGPEFAEMHINTLETAAIWIGLSYTMKETANTHVRIRCDNTTAVAAVKKQGCFKNEDRNYFAREIWDIAKERNIWLSIEHIPGIENVEADEASRYFRDSAEWGITRQIQEAIFRRWGTPYIDLFATSRNRVLERFASWGPDPEACIIDSFQADWGSFSSVYIFPPVPLIPKVIQKIIMERARGILIVPNWEAQMWYRHLLKIQTDFLDFICDESSIYLSVDTEMQRRNCPFGHTLRAVAFSGDSFW